MVNKDAHTHKHTLPVCRPSQETHRGDKKKEASSNRPPEEIKKPPARGQPRNRTQASSKRRPTKEENQSKKPPARDQPRNRTQASSKRRPTKEENPRSLLQEINKGPATKKPLLASNQQRKRNQEASCNRPAKEKKPRRSLFQESNKGNESKKPLPSSRALRRPSVPRARSLASSRRRLRTQALPPTETRRREDRSPATTSPVLIKFGKAVRAENDRGTKGQDNIDECMRQTTNQCDRQQRSRPLNPDQVGKSGACTQQATISAPAGKGSRYIYIDARK